MNITENKAFQSTKATFQSTKATLSHLLAILWAGFTVHNLKPFSTLTTLQSLIVDWFYDFIIIEKPFCKSDLAELHSPFKLRSMILNKFHKTYCWMLSFRDIQNWNKTFSNLILLTTDVPSPSCLTRPLSCRFWHEVRRYWRHETLHFSYQLRDTNTISIPTNMAYFVVYKIKNIPYLSADSPLM